MKTQDLNLVILLFNALIFLIFSCLTYRQTKNERLYNAKVRWFKDFFSIKKDIETFYNKLNEVYRDCIASTNCTSKMMSRIDLLKTDFLNGTVKYFLVFSNDMYVQCSKHVEDISDKLITDIVKKNPEFIGDKEIRNSEINLYKLIFDYDVNSLFL